MFRCAARIFTNIVVPPTARILSYVLIDPDGFELARRVVVAGAKVVGRAHQLSRNPAVTQGVAVARGAWSVARFSGAVAREIWRQNNPFLILGGTGGLIAGASHLVGQERP